MALTLKIREMFLDWKRNDTIKDTVKRSIRKLFQSMKKKIITNQ